MAALTASGGASVVVGVNDVRDNSMVKGSGAGRRADARRPRLIGQSEIVPNGELDEPWLNDRGRPRPRRAECIDLRQDRV